MHARDMDFGVDSDAMQTRAAGDDRLPISISSETPVERYDFWEGERYNEVLDHSPDAIDLSYARDGMPFLVDHDTGEQVGLIEDVRVSADRKLRGMVRFSKAQRAQEIRQDMVDGIRKKISVGYRIDTNNLERTQSPGEVNPTVRVKRWTPMEASSVPIPADYSVGVGRSLRIPPAPPTLPAPKAKEQPVANDNTAADPGAARTDGTEAPKGASLVSTRERSDEGVTWADVGLASQIHGMAEEAMRAQGEGKSPREVLKVIADEVRARMTKGPVIKPKVELTPKEERQYSFARAILQASDGSGGFETDVSQEIAKHLPQGHERKGNGFYIPTTIGTRAGLDSKTSTTGTELKFIEPGAFIDMLRNKAQVMKLGATALAGLDSPITFPLQTTAGTASWVAENPGSDVSDTNLTLGTRSLSPKTLQSTTSFSRQLLRQAVIDVENLVRNDLAAIHALAIDLAAIAGTAASNQPSGIFTTSGVGLYTIGTNGGAPILGTLIGLEATVEEANALIGPAGYLTTPGIKATLKNTAKLTNTAGIPVWDGGSDDGTANGYRALASNQVQSNITKGTSTTICHVIYFGVWSQLYIGEWGALEIITDPYRLKKQGMIEVTSFQMIDIMLRYPSAFAICKDALSSF